MTQASPLDPKQLGMSAETKVTPLSGGANSQVCLLEEPGQEPVVCKRYFVSANDIRDRQGTEAGALGFLDAARVRTVPRLLRVDVRNSISLLSYIAGQPVTRCTENNISKIAEFVNTLIRLSGVDMARRAGFHPASETFFSAAGVIGNIDLRLERLKSVGVESDVHEACREFLDHSLVPKYAVYCGRCSSVLQEGGMAIDEDIPDAWRILSPSDVGIHNAIERVNGELAFIDFEFFGWDDPSKMLADFCLHPAMNLPVDLQSVFVDRVVPVLESIGYKRLRAKALFPLFAVKWCCIILNEFVPRDAARRQFSGSNRAEDRAVVLRRQLDKAVALLGSLEDRSSHFSRMLDRA